jgi:Ca2+/Na+ antiporter
MKQYIFILLLALIFWVLAQSEVVLADEQTGHEDHHQSSFSLFSLVRPLGIATLCFVFTTFLTGLFRRKLLRRFQKIHLSLAIVSVILGLTHGILVLVLYG